MSEMYDIWKFELVFDNCDSVDVNFQAIEGLHFDRTGTSETLVATSSGMLMNVEHCIDNVYIRLSLRDPKLFRRFGNTTEWSETPFERVKNCDDITHIQINNDYLAVPFDNATNNYKNELQVNEVTDETITIKICKNAD